MAIFSLCIKSAPQSAGAVHALAFANACVQLGHSINRVFFYSDAVYIGLNTSVLPQGETSISRQWQAFLMAHNIDAVVCIAAALRRGVLDDTEAARLSLPSGGLLREGFSLSGLGQWVAANSEADRVLTFG
jgi:tRNA 2-thiouridine synthesizing protein D